MDNKVDLMSLLKLIASIIMSLIGLGIAVYFLTTSNDSQLKTWAAALIGGIIGYWIK